ncbi:calpain-like cysteine peptidase [Trypanosoma conorhini]|uniref:Calpain-like cysteine peptidase n=1 Tax=Trypanosoma conorhini TaxID=83891 RepID=A0A422PRE2_9TRYP|nr:calpain-like cysteine peptidase [Trypanosoma conorhini]RNF20273.1 calpain-like cysteine peptidase [Trypanosoma conorhini]
MPSATKAAERNYAANPRNTEDASYPATEPGEIDNASIFSASVEFDAAEKPHAADARANGRNGDGDAQDASDRERSLASPESLERHGGPAPTNVLRKQPKQPTRWEPLGLAVPQDDPEDEFDIGTARKPVFQEEAEKTKYAFVNGEPEMEGEVMSCFEEPGLLYRIVNKKNKVWAFYNDSLAFEVHVTCTFGKHSKVEPLGRTTMSRAPDGSYTAEVVVYPTETELFMKGFVNGFNSRLRALPLSDEYFQTRDALQHSQVQEEIAAVQGLVGEWKGAEEALKRCIAENVPFTDLEFPPVWNSIQRGATRTPKQMPWFRPRMQLREELVDQLRLFRSKVAPGDVQQGELGDCWLMCAMATLEENPADVMRLFRCPLGAATARLERAVGAYRVTLNTNGLWGSVIVDDYFPGYAGRPRFAHSSDACELWPSVLEKAFAKVNGSYGLVQSGDPVHALSDMTGCPSSRFDEAFAEAQKDGGEALFQQLLQHRKCGYQLVLTTAGKAPALIIGTNKLAGVLGEGQEPEHLLEGTGILPGHAFTVTDVRHFPEHGDVRLLQIRNVWGSCEDWGGPWSATSAEWEAHPEVSRACGAGRDAADSTIWMDWQHVLRCFEGGGVIYRHVAYDYRLPLTFADCRPSVVLEVSVASPVWICFMLRNIDPRTTRDYADHADEPHEYPPLMLSLATAHEAQDGAFRVMKNTSVDTAAPSGDKWTFVQAREISMLCRLIPEASPYLLIPRMMESEDTVSGSQQWFANLRNRVSPLHFNNRSEAQAAAVAEGAAEVPVVLGVRCSKPIGAEGDGGVKVDFKCLGDDNVVFENFPKFPAETVTQKGIYYQVMPPTRGYAEERVGASIA